MEVRRALLLSTGERYVVLAINFATIAAVSRILSPGEIGVSVVGTAIVGIAITVREFASSSFIIQRPELRTEDIRSTFTIMLVLTVAITAALVAAAPLIAAAYGQVALTAYFQVICACLFVELISAQVVTLLRRELAFGRVAAINVAGAGSAAVATISLALAGFSYMSFAWGWLAAACTATVVALLTRPSTCSFLPTLRNWRAMIHFGGYNGGNVLLYKIFEQVPYLVLGRVVSADAAGLLSRSMMICQLPDKFLLGGSAAVAMPAFAAASRQGRPLAKPYLTALGWATGLLWPAHIVLAILAYPVVDLLLGSQWHGAVPLVQIMAIGSLFAFSFEFNYAVLVAVGAIRDAFVRALIVFPIAAVLVGAAAYFGGVQATAWSLMIVAPFHAYVALQFVRRRLGLRWADVGVAVRKSALVAVLSGLGPLAVVATCGSFDIGLVNGFLGGGLAAVGWVVGLHLTRHPLAEELSRLAATVFRARPQPRLAEETGG